MCYVTRNGVKELEINMSDNKNCILPCYVFNCPTLTHMELLSCVFKPPSYFLAFRILQIFI